MNDTYSVRVYCANCGEGRDNHFYVRIKKGKTVPKKFSDKCFTCGCLTLKRYGK